MIDLSFHSPNQFTLFICSSDEYVCVMNWTIITRHICAVNSEKQTKRQNTRGCDLLHMTGTVQSVSSVSQICVNIQGVFVQFGSAFE